MTLLAGLAVGVFVYFFVGFATGYSPEIKIRRFRRRTQITNRQLWLNQAGVAVTPRQFVAGSVAVGGVAFIALVALTGAPLVALVPAAGVTSFPRAYFSRRRAAHLRQVQAAWPDGLRDLIASIAAGRSLPQALNALAASGPAPLQEAFARFPMLSRMLGTVPALEVIKDELADPSRFNSHPHGSEDGNRTKPKGERSPSVGGSMVVVPGSQRKRLTTTRPAVSLRAPLDARRLAASHRDDRAARADSRDGRCGRYEVGWIWTAHNYQLRQGGSLRIKTSR